MPNCCVLLSPQLMDIKVIFEPTGGLRTQNLYVNLAMLLVHDMKWIDRGKSKLQILSQLNRWDNSITKLNQINVENVCL